MKTKIRIIILIILAGLFPINLNFEKNGVFAQTAPAQTNIFIKTLQRNSRGDDVKQLQEFLKKYPDIYPEGLITGYFGPLTEKAVQRFQAKFQIVSLGSPVTTGYGFVGTKTRAKLNELVSGKTTRKGTEEKISTSIQVPSSAGESSDSDQLQQFFQWADERKIKIIDTDGGSLAAMPGINQVFEGLRAIPSHLMKFLENETISLTNRSCLNNAQMGLDKSGPEIKKIVVYQLCRPFSRSVAAHEFGHLVDWIGIRNERGSEFSFGKTDEKIRAIRDEYDRIFGASKEYERMYQTSGFTAPPAGFISIYSVRAQLEDFADHFSAYIFQPQYFRERAAKEPLLAEKYEFLKTKIFLGKEYY